MFCYLFTYYLLEYLGCHCEAAQRSIIIVVSLVSFLQYGCHNHFFPFFRIHSVFYRVVNDSFQWSWDYVQPKQQHVLTDTVQSSALFFFMLFITYYNFCSVTILSVNFRFLDFTFSVSFRVGSLIWLVLSLVQRIC